MWQLSTSCCLWLCMQTVSESGCGLQKQWGHVLCWLLVTTCTDLRVMMGPYRLRSWRLGAALWGRRLESASLSHQGGNGGFQSLRKLDSSRRSGGRCLIAHEAVAGRQGSWRLRSVHWMRGAVCLFGCFEILIELSDRAAGDWSRFHR